MSDNNIKDNITAFGVKTLLNHIDKNPEKSIEKTLNLLVKLDKNGKYIGNRAGSIQQFMSDKDNNWYKLVNSLWTDIDDGVRRKFIENFVVNASLKGAKLQDKARKEHKCNIPMSILMDPTSACNLNCIGCWAAEYGNKLNMDYDTLNSIINQGKELGIYSYIYSGGEPLVRKKHIIKLCEEHDDCIFLAFTNGTLIDEEFADEMLRVKNFVPAISVEGFEEETDFRRGKGTYKALTNAMEILKRKKLIFGISCCYTSKNTETIGSEEYFDDMIAKGAKFAWLFTYMPVGADAVPKLMATAKQREYMYHQVRAFRKTKPLFTLDFWNDGEFAGGCVAGGRRYLHINANGDIEPCAFIHYSNSNIHKDTLLDALKSPLFMQYRAHQPFNYNHLRPCPLLDNKDKLAEMVEKSGAKSTDLQNPEDVRALCAKCAKTADKWAETADVLWNRTSTVKKQEARRRSYYRK